MRHQTMLIAGASSGIGRHLFLHYRELEKYDVHGCARSECEEKNIHCCDCTDPVQVFSLINDLRPDILINCVGQACMNHILFTSTSQYERVMGANLRAIFLLCREAGRHMYSRKYGRIINFGSCAVSMEIEGEAIYGASKSSVNLFSRILARELAPWVTCNIVSCGPVDTRLIAKVTKDKIQSIIDRQIIKRMTTFADVQRTIDFLVDPAVECITGQNIYLNGAG